MRVIPESKVDESHPDHGDLCKIAAAIYEAVGGRARLEQEVPRLVRQALDDVIDASKTGRATVSELEKTEKTYIGTRIEIVIRDFLRAQKGKLDMKIAGYDVDIKNTVTGSWAIPPEALNKPCLLVLADDERGRCYVGLMIARCEYLGKKEGNRDGKRGILKSGLENALWLIEDEPFPKGFWENLGREKTKIINDPSVASAKRVARLFRSVQETPISREIVAQVARQLDPAKRIRHNGGARDLLGPEGIAILSGAQHRNLIRRLRLPACSREEFISVVPKDRNDRAILVRQKLLPPKGAGPQQPI